jgi:aspartyl-tRNA(Asn)/glutamyl-tRNA(Gln) amidotransferase subunit C
MPLAKEEIERLARLARLHLTADEIERFSRELMTIVDYFNQLKAVDTSGVEPLQHRTMTDNSLREDISRPSLPRAEALRNAPDSDGEFFRVPRVID